jgi:uncharacterized membrane protein SpoIIM required for sporulation
MTSNRWIEKRRIYWDRMAFLMERAGGSGLRSLTSEELREMALLYRQIASDLSSVRQDGTARVLEGSLNALLARAHSVIYSGRRTDFRVAVRFWRSDYPCLFRRLLPFTLASLVIFLGGGLLGTLLTLARPEFMHTLLGPWMVRTIEHREMWTHSITSVAPQASSSILTNNLSVTFATFAAGITAGLGTIYLIGWNGILIGVIATACYQAHMSLKLWSFVAPHGSLELPSIVIAGGAGLRLAYGMLFPGMYSRRHSLAVTGAEATRLIAGTIPLLVIAGIVEGFFSPSGAPAATKLIIGAALFTLLMMWLFSAWPAAAVPRTPEGEITGSLSLQEHRGGKLPTKFAANAGHIARISGGSK